MLRLVLFRHAEAVPHAADGDRERSLTPAGIAAATRMGVHLRDAGIVPDLVLVSSSRRTRETFAAAEAGYAATWPARFEPSLYNAPDETVQALIGETPAEIKCLVVIGHNPSLAECALRFSARGSTIDLSRLQRHFPAPCLAIVDFASMSWQEAASRGGDLESFITLAMLDRAEEG